MNFPTTEKVPNWQTMQEKLANAAPGERMWLGKVSGFPENFENDVKSLYRQMARCYFHLYHGHWLDFYHVGMYKEVNTCFMHFVTVAKLFDLLQDRDLKPMQPLLEIWQAKGILGASSQAQIPAASTAPTTPTAPITSAVPA